MNDPKQKSDRSETNPVPDDGEYGSATSMFRNPLRSAPADETKSGWTEFERASPTPDLSAKNLPVSETRVQHKPEESAGEFTGFFQALAPVEPGPTPAPADAQTADPTPQPEAPQQEPGDFTRIFLQVQAPAVEIPGPTETTGRRSSGAPVQVPQARDTGPGEFTQFMSRLGRVPPESSTVHQEPGLPGSPAARQLKGFSTPGASDFASVGPSGVAEFLQTPPTAAQASTPARFEGDRVIPPPVQSRSDTQEQPISFAPRRAEGPGPSRGEAGEFTRLMQSLSDTGSHPMHDGTGPLTTSTAGPAVSPKFPAGLSAESGEFTRLMQGLSPATSPESEALPGFERVAVAPPPQTVSNQSGGYTRIISGSLLREAQQAQSAPNPTTTAAAGQPFSGLPPMPIPHTPPTVPIPHAPGLPAVNPKGKLERYLPLLLILNGFLLAVLILLVAFSLRSR